MRIFCWYLGHFLHDWQEQANTPDKNFEWESLIQLLRKHVMYKEAKIKLIFRFLKKEPTLESVFL